jgi:hypothetical protein
MTDDLRPDLRSALRDLADHADVPPLDPAALQSEASGRLRRRRLAVGASFAAVLLAAPLAWTAVPREDDGLVQEFAAPPRAGDRTSGSFEVRYDSDDYDDPAARQGLSACAGLPGLVSGTPQDALPPVDQFAFSGSPAQQAVAQSCLARVPAADVTFVPGGRAGTLTVHVSQEGSELVEVSAGPLRPATDAWLEHELLVTNRSEQTVYLSDFRVKELVQADLAVTSGCSYTPTPDGSPDFACFRYSPSNEVPPRQTLRFAVQLHRDKPGLAALASGKRVVTTGFGLRSNSAFSVPGDQTEEAVSLQVTYDVADVELPRSSPAPSQDGYQTVQAYFGDLSDAGPFCDGVKPVPREVPATESVATVALRELFRGPTEDEVRLYGVGSAFSAVTADLLRSVHVEAGTAYVDLRPFDQFAAGTALGGYGTSCGMGAFYGQVEATLRQFPTVREVRYAFDGDPRAFVEYMQGGCPDPIPAGDPCDPAPFRR